MPRVEAILPKLLRLRTSERARLALELVQSLDGPSDPDAAETWLKEIERRTTEVASGKVELVDWAKARRKIEASLRRARG